MRKELQVVTEQKEPVPQWGVLAGNKKSCGWSFASCQQQATAAGRQAILISSAGLDKIKNPVVQ
jgi:hypothetical protein